MGNLIVRQIQFLLEKMNLRQNSYRQVEGMRRSIRMRVTSPLMFLSPISLSPLFLPLSPLSFLPLSVPSLSCPSLSPLFPAPLSPLSFLPLSLPCLSVSLISSPVSPPLSPISPLLHFCLVLPLFYLSLLSLSPLCLFLPCLSPSPVSPHRSLSLPSPRLSRLSFFSVCSSSLHSLYHYNGINNISIWICRKIKFPITSVHKMQKLRRIDVRRIDVRRIECDELNATNCHATNWSVTS